MPTLRFFLKEGIRRPYSLINSFSALSAPLRLKNKGMEHTQRQKIEAAGGKVVTIAEFLDLSPEEMEIIEIRLSLSKSLKKFTQQEQLSQQKLAENINSSQSRVAKMEASDPSVSINLLIKSLLALGATREDIATAIAGN
jgi:predicted XRE-type DNA-binding protein